MYMRVSPRPLGCRREDVEHKGRSCRLMQKKSRRRSSDRYCKLNLPSTLLHRVFRHLWQVRGRAASGRCRPPILNFSLASTFPSLIQPLVRTLPTHLPKKNKLPARVGQPEAFKELIWKNSEGLVLDFFFFFWILYTRWASLYLSGPYALPDFPCLTSLPCRWEMIFSCRKQTDSSRQCCVQLMVII